MSNFKNFNRVLFLLLILTNLYVSFEYIISQESSLNNDNIELVIAKNQTEKDIINFDQFHQSFSLNKSIQSYKNTYSFKYQVQTKNLFDQVKFHIQKHTALNLKSLFLQIVISEISFQKSYCS